MCLLKLKCVVCLFLSTQRQWEYSQRVLS